MKIINSFTNHALSETGSTFIVGSVTGPVRMTGGVLQFALNMIALIGSIVATPFVNKEHAWSLFNEENRPIRDALVGIEHLFFGIVETCPIYGFMETIMESSVHTSNDQPLLG